MGICSVSKQELLVDIENSLRNNYLNQSRASQWWLRSPGSDEYYAAVIGTDGTVDNFGENARDVD
jgi:hypothetical protein